MTVLRDGKKVRLYGVDCPEKRQAFGTKAKRFTSDLTGTERVELVPITVADMGGPSLTSTLRVTARTCLRNLSEMAMLGFTGDTAREGSVGIG